MRERDWLTTDEVAKLLGLSQDYARRLAAQGRIEAQDTGLAWLFYAPSVKAFMAAPKMKPGRKPKVDLLVGRGRLCP